MNHLITSAVSLTNQGADKLATGEYFAAASAFCRAVKVTQLLSERANDDSSSSSSEEACAWRYEALPVLSAELPCGEIAIFEHCFVVVPHSSLNVKTVTTEHCHVFTAALIYNLALTYHYGGICGNSQERMNDGLNLYAKAFDILQGQEETRDGRALLLALCNNAASLSLVLSDDIMHQEFSSYIQELLSKPSSKVADLDVSFYLRNIAMWENQTARHYRTSTIHNIPTQQDACIQ